MSSAGNQGGIAMQRVDDSIPEKEKGQGDRKSDKTHKRPASEVNSTEDDVKQKILKKDHKGELMQDEKEKENGESEEKYEEGDDADDDDDVVPEGEGEDYDEGDEGEGDEDGAEEEVDDDDEDDA